MDLPNTPPSDSVFSVRPGNSGWFAYAIQVALNEVSASVVEDGNYGPQTTKAVYVFQGGHGLYQDGIAGPATQPKIVSLIGGKVEAMSAWLARGYLRGISQAEASGMISVVNWSVPEGVDVGAVQRRVKGPPFAHDALVAAFDSGLQFERIAADWRGRRDAYLSYSWSSGNHERAGRCAALAHNWPAGAESMAKSGAVLAPRTKASWIPRDASGTSLVHFPDGTLVETQGQWAAYYALGGPHGEGVVSRYVTDWR